MIDQTDEGPQEIISSEQNARQELVGLLVNIQEAERRRISRDLHDETGQTLIVLEIILDMLQSEIPAEFPQLHDRLHDARELTRLAADQLRALVQDLRPPALDLLGLKRALEEHCRAFQHYTRISIDAAIAELPEFPDPYGITIYRCLQEALTNAARHGHASQIWVSLTLIKHQWVLSVRDDGKGMDPEAPAPAPNAQQLGLEGLRERLSLLGGSLEIDSHAGQGTLVLARLPEPGMKPHPVA